MPYRGSKDIDVGHGTKWYTLRWKLFFVEPRLKHVWSDPTSYDGPRWHVSMSVGSLYGSSIVIPICIPA